MDKKKEEKKVTKKAKTPRELRIELANSKSKIKERKVRDEFRKYFAKLKRKLNLDNSLEEVIWLHFKATGYDKKSKFDEGIIHFGYKI
jgi:hypothetical protein